MSECGGFEVGCFGHKPHRIEKGSGMVSKLSTYSKKALPLPSLCFSLLVPWHDIISRMSNKYDHFIMSKVGVAYLSAIMRFFSLTVFLLSCFCVHAQLTVTEVAQLPEAVANNAVCEGFADGVSYLYSFGGIDKTKKSSGIHLKSFRVNLQTGKAEQIADLPDNMGKVAAAASRIGKIIYITGGYYVFPDGSETTSDKLHRYNTETNEYWPDGPDLPVGTDDHVQAVWRDSLLFLITGWNNTGNIARVQFFDPSTQLWERATSIPNNHDYKSFGASGTIIGDTIYYFGGASSAAGFNIQNQLRKGVINPKNPKEITWEFSVPDTDVVGYRMASTMVENQVHWIGGSGITYNYNGIAYNGSGGVQPLNRDLFWTGTKWQETLVKSLPMDLRGIARVNDTVQYIAGGMVANQEVSDKVYKLEWGTPSNIKTAEAITFQAYPTVFDEHLTFEASELNKDAKWNVYDTQGREVYSRRIDARTQHVSTIHWPSGMYFIRAASEGGVASAKVVKP